MENHCQNRDSGNSIVASLASGAAMPVDGNTRTLETPRIDELPLYLALERIFMPFATRQRDLAFKEQTGRSLYEGADDDRLQFVHYTSAEAALSIINTKRMWMRNTSCMSDYREVQHGFDILQKYFLDKERAAKFTAALDACAPGVAQEAIKIFDQWWTHPAVSTRFNTYITSLSMHWAHENQHGRLSMWRAFGAQSTPRVAVVFSLPKFTAVQAADALNLLFSPVAYLPEKHVHKVIEEVISNVHENCDFLQSVDRTTVLNAVFNMFIAGVTCLKHEGFHEEREWRAIYSPKRNPSSLMDFAVEVVGGVPQPVYKIPLDATVNPALATLDFARIFDRIIIGPSPYPWPMFQAFVEALTKSGVSDAAQRVSLSLIPIRM
jgi:hypothetical protein